MAFIDLMKEKAKQDVMTIILSESNDKRTLIAAAQVLKEKTADLIMIGATGLNAVERILIGSVTEFVTRTAICDVLVVRTDLDNQPIPVPKKR